MFKSFLTVFAIIVAGLMFGCAKSETTNRGATAPATQTSPAASPAATVVTASSNEPIGVTECDTFLAAYEKCVHDKVPEAARAQFNSGMAQWRKSWHDLAKNPQTKGTLASICKTQLDQAKQSMKAYNCTF